MGIRVQSVIFGKKVRKPADITDDLEFEDYALEIVESQANNFIAENHLGRNDILTYKVRMKHATEKIKRQVKGGQQITDVVAILQVRIIISFIVEEEEEGNVGKDNVEQTEVKKELEIPEWAKTKYPF